MHKDRSVSLSRLHDELLYCGYEKAFYSGAVFFVGVIRRILPTPIKLAPFEKRDG